MNKNTALLLFSILISFLIPFIIILVCQSIFTLIAADFPQIDGKTLLEISGFYWVFLGWIIPTIVFCSLDWNKDEHNPNQANNPFDDDDGEYLDLSQDDITLKSNDSSIKFSPYMISYRESGLVHVRNGKFTKLGELFIVMDGDNITAVLKSTKTEQLILMSSKQKMELDGKILAGMTFQHALNSVML